jgi:integrase
MLKSAEPYEIKYGKDLSGFTQEEMQDFVDKTFGVSHLSRRARFSSIKTYLKWCADNGIGAGIGVLDKVSTDDIKAYKERYVSSAKHLQAILDEIFKPEEDLSIDNVYRAYFWLAFCGIPQGEIMNVKKSDIKFDTSEIAYQGCYFYMNQYAIKSISNCAKLTEFRRYNSIYKNGFTMCEREHSDALLCGVSARGYKGLTYDTISDIVRKRIKKVFANVDTVPKIDVSHMYKSGLFVRAYAAEKENGVEPDFKDVILIENRISTAKPLTEAQVKKRLSQRGREFRHDYKLWKSAFDL